MTAEEAKNKASTAIGTCIKAPYVAIINKAIDDAASKGKYSLFHPLSLCKGLPYPEEHIRAAIWNDFISRGFLVLHKPDPDPGNIVSGPYTEIRWD
jgi:hypothetical protein